MEWAAGGNRYHGVKVRTKDGRTFTCFRTHREVLGPETTMAMDNVVRKFHGCAEFSGICPPKKAKAIVDSVMELDKTAKTAELIQASLILL